MKVADVLEQKAAGNVETIDATVPMRSASERFLAVKARSLVVMEGTKTVGIVTPRDLLRAIHAGESLATPVRRAMSSDLATATPDMPVDAVQTLFTTRRINHVPVIENGTLVGVLTLADLLGTHLESAEGLNEDLRRYIAGPYAL